MGGRGASIPTSIPGGGGGGGRGNDALMDMMPGAPKTLEEALGSRGRPMSDANAVMKANPFYEGPNNREYSENCQRAVVATEARFRGYDVIAQPTYSGDTLPNGDEWKKSFKNAKTEYIGKTTAKATQNAVEQKMSEYGNGARAVLAVEWKGGGGDGHVINLVQKNGKTNYYDGQSGKKYAGKDIFKKAKSKSTELVRVDNLDFGVRAKEAVRQNPFKKK